MDGERDGIRHCINNMYYLDFAWPEMVVNEAFVINEEQPGLEESKPLHSFLPTLKRWLREPLLHFLLLGAALFGIY